MIRAFIYIATVLLLFSCQNEKAINIENDNSQSNGVTLFSELSSEQTSIDFINQISNSKDFNIFNYRNYYNGGGVGIGDINNDDLVDIYFTSNLGVNKLYLNKGDFKFEDISSSAGVTLSDKWSTGVSMIDINADGYLDIYVCNAGFKKGKDQKNALFINQQDNTFVDEAEAYGLAINDYSTSAAFFDYDMDGDLDMYLLNNSFIPVNTLNYANKRNLRAEDWPVEEFLKGGGDKLFKNQNGKFRDVSEEAGILGSLIGFGLGVSLGDLNKDGFTDIYISNDFFEKDYLYINKGDGSFSEELEGRIKHISHSSMGSDIADINNDGLPEIFVTDMLPDDDYRLKTTTTFDNINVRNLKRKNGFYNQFMHNTLQLNNGDGKFSEIAFYSDVAASDWSWGALFLDADNDGYKDLFVSNGILNDVIDQDFIDFFANDIIQKMVLTGSKENVDSIVQKMPSTPLVNKLFMNLGNLKFVENQNESGFKTPSFSNGAAYGDLDNDGDLDLVVNNVNMAAQILKNNSQNHYSSIELNYKDENINGIGSKVTVYANEKMFYQELFPSRGFQSSIDYKMTIGLGDIAKIDSVVVQWPDNTVQIFGEQEVDILLKLNYQRGSNKLYNNSASANKFLVEQEHKLAKHEEDGYEDFLYERNIPVQLSKEGPCMAKGDFDGDGDEDLYIGGGTDQSPSLYKNVNGKFVAHQVDYFERFKAFEDTDAIFFDCDKDGDLDLYVASGGNNVTYVKRAFRDRLYINNNGNFEINYNALPPISLNTSKVISFDIEGDGDLDLFVGMRSVPGEYGLSPGSYIYLNNGRGQFLDVTKQIVPELALAGMITDAIIADVLPNSGSELILVGEWMSPKILSFNGQKFEIIPSDLDNYAGWWQSIAADDVDQDGDIDLVLGNIGENFYLQASKEEPLFLFVNDFNKDGSYQKVLAKRRDGKDYPVMVKRDMIDQFAFLKKENLMHSEFANKTIQDLFDTSELGTSIIKKIDIQKSIVAKNNGEGSFEIEFLNPEVQLSCVNKLLFYDINGDNFKDLILGGNNTMMLPQFSNIDACQGKVLLNDTKGKFQIVGHQESGLELKGVVRDIELIELNKTPHLLFGINDDLPKLFKIDTENK